jgi:two-component system heavy metal sensor histidine kinase CusS
MKAPGSVMSRSSLALRLAIASSVFGLIVTAGAVLLGYWALSQQLDQRAATEIEGKVALMAHLLSEMQEDAAIPAQAHRFNDLLVGHDDLHLAIADAQSGQVLWTSSSLAEQSMLDSPSRSARDFLRDRTENQNGRYTSASGVRPLSSGHLVRFDLSLDRRQDQVLLNAFLSATLLGTPFLLVLIAGGVWLVVNTGLLPLRRFRRLASSVSTTTLAQRLSLEGMPAELHALGQDFNAMLERIDHGVARLQEFSGDLAHEMRTPVATLMGRSQVALSHPRTNEELRSVLESNIEELQRLARMITDMLFIARTDRSDVLLDRSDVDVSMVARQVAEYLSILADDRQISVEVQGQVWISGDHKLLQRAVTNLLSNAIRHAVSGSIVRIDISRRDEVAFLAVTNKGNEIEARHLEKIFERFYRVDSARARHDGGTGLGLAIVQSIMAAHGGRATARSGGGLTTVTLEIPVAPPVCDTRRP